MALHEKLTSLAKDAATKANSLAKDQQGQHRH